MLFFHIAFPSFGVFVVSPVDNSSFPVEDDVGVEHVNLFLRTVLVGILDRAVHCLTTIDNHVYFVLASCHRYTNQELKRYRK